MKYVKGREKGVLGMLYRVGWGLTKILWGQREISRAQFYFAEPS
jgi:hypothetical protein